MKQYWDMKSAHQDKILLFRMGDFFEMFHEDAVHAAPILGVALTARNKKSADQTPMCGVPHHSIAGHINKLLSHGLKVAICDQVEDAKLAKGLVKRAVTRILSPGMVYDPETLDGHAFNYLCSFDSQTVSFLEPTTGECFFYAVSEAREQAKLIAIINPVEIVLDSRDLDKVKTLLGDGFVYSSHDSLYEASGVSASGRRLLDYAVSMQGPEILQTTSSFEEREYNSRLQVDAEVLRHLEVFKTYKGDAKGSLFEAINATLTAGGSRRLRQWLCFPLRQENKINGRLNEIALWLSQNEALKMVRQSLKGIGDLERKMGKISHPNAHPRDLRNLAETFQHISDILEYFPEKKEAQKKINLWRRELDRLLEDELPLAFRDGGIIRKGVSPELDELIELATNSQGKILELEAKERELTQIPSLKVRYNGVFGFYIEITHTHAAKVPLQRYQRKQTLTNAERYTTDELVDLERKAVSARTRRAELEIEIYQQLKKDLLAEMQDFLKLAHFLSDLDAITALAWLALENNYCRPAFSATGDLKLKASRHAVVERNVSFVPNDIHLAAGQCLLLTGPNMAGKSTIMRQVAITALMAQMGSYVPASQAVLPIYDRIFTRIGASDFLTEGLSTFMVEMKETAVMLKEATPQ
jgi:DNA mismatch repair protein MutS